MEQSDKSFAMMDDPTEEPSNEENVKELISIGITQENKISVKAASELNQIEIIGYLQLVQANLVLQGLRA